MNIECKNELVGLLKLFSTRVKKKGQEQCGDTWIFDMQNCNDTINGKDWQKIYEDIYENCYGVTPKIYGAVDHWTNLLDIEEHE